MLLDQEKLRTEGGLLLVNKPKTWTSFDVVNKIRYALKIKKVGHAGTLDPLATGLLLIGVGKGTKMLNELQGFDKTYTGIIELGKTTPSYDLETAFDSENSIEGLTNEAITDAVGRLIGEIEQVPPSHSAVRVNGTRAYKLARQNQEVIIKKRLVNVKGFKVDIDLPEVHFEINCTKGTYIRSIASDLGKFTAVGGYLKLLRRTRIGEYSIDDAWELDTLLEQIGKHESN